MPWSLEQIKQLDPPRWQIPTRPIITEPVPAVSSVKATGKEGFIRVQWAPVNDVSGYRVAIMTDKELDTPDIGIKTEWGGKATYHDYMTGNVALTINFAVQAFRDQDFGKFSAIVSATSSLMTAAGGAAPSSPAPPSGSSEPPAAGAGGTTGTGRRLNTL